MERILCPDCPQFKKVDRNGNQITVGSCLELVEHNYSGCGVDHFQCPKCDSMFEVSYKIAEVKKIGE